MFSDAGLCKEPSRKAGPFETNPKHLDLENPDTKSHLFEKGEDKPPRTGTSNPQELTLSYLCDNPKLGLREKEVYGKNFLGALEKLRCKGKEVILESPVDEEDHRWVERDFLQLTGDVCSKGASKRELSEGTDGCCELREKKVKMETLNLSLGPPNLSLSLNTSNPLPSTTAPSAALVADPPSSGPAKRSQSNNTHDTRTSSDDFPVSVSCSYSHPFSHNPSCSLMPNSTENYENSRENDHIWYAGAGEGTNGSVHSRFKPVADTNNNNISFSNHSGYPHLPNGNKETNNRLYRADSFENHSLYPSELPARQRNENGLVSSDGGRKVIFTRPERILGEIVSGSIPIVAQILKNFQVS